MSSGDFGHTQTTVQGAVSNGIPPPSVPLPLPDSPDIITANLLLLLNQTPNPRHKFVFQHLVKYLHAFVKETNLTTDEWMTAIQFLTRVGHTCTPLRQEMILLSDVFGVSALVDCLNNPAVDGATENIQFGGSIASEGKGDYMYVEGRVLTTEGEPIADAVIETWETDDKGYYDTQYSDRSHPDCRGRLRSAKDGSFGYRAIVPCPYPIPGDGPVGELLLAQGRHNMRPNHLHLMVEAPGYHKLISALYPEGCHYITSDAVFGVKKSLVVKLEQVDDDEEARKRGFPKGGSFKLLRHDIVLVTEEQSSTAREQAARASGQSYLETKDD
ncbi:aromatic compound dioxygenase [Chiua virens]|nr:aromatic compound dioxygenase [Chiua virens]